MGKLVMAYWDCPFCGSQGIRGDVMTCPSCGRARGDVKFYMKDHAEGQTREQGDTGDIEYVDEEKAKYINRNPDWYCSFCDSLNSDNAQFCSNCGASRESSESNYFDMLKKKEAREANRAEGPKPVQAQSQAQAAPKSKRPLVIFGVILLIALVYFLFFNKTSGNFTITGLAWERDIQIEENIQYSESGWTMPATAELVEQKQEFHHFDSVFDHNENVEVQRSREVFDHYRTFYTYEDLGNGYLEEVTHKEPVYRTEYYTEIEQRPVYVQVPRYATKYYYTIWRWTPTRKATSSGSDHNTFWPELDLADNERAGDRAEYYYFSVKDKNEKTTTYLLNSSANEDLWMKLNIQDGLYISSNRLGTDIYISDKDGNRIADIVRVQ